MARRAKTKTFHIHKGPTTNQDFNCAIEFFLHTIELFAVAPFKT